MRLLTHHAKGLVSAKNLDSNPGESENNNITINVY